MSLLHNRIKFTSMVEKSAGVPKDDLKPVLEQVRATRAEIIKGLQHRANWDRLRNLNTLYQEFDDVLTEMMAGGAADVWKAECKFYDRADGSIFMSCNGAELDCGNHYPDREMLVTTALTRQARQKFFDCLVNNKVMSVYGTLGTGKTETMKDFFMMLGRHVEVIGCAPGVNMTDLDLQEFSRNKNLILDDFNVLSSENQERVMKALRDAGCNVMLTANPGDPNRSEYTWKDKHAHEEMAFTVPDRVTIMRVQLSAVGIPNYDELASKIVALYKDCEDNLSKQKHYDFGLRALLSACRGMHKWMSLKMNFDEAIFCASSYHTERFNEMCVKADREAALAMIHKHLGPDRRELEHQANFTVGPLLEVRHAAAVIGNIDAAAQKNIQEIAEKLWGWKPVNVEWATEEVTFGKEGDGTFVKALREAIASKERTAIYFSGEGWANFKDWANKFDTVTDDNKFLYLASGERIKFGDNIRIVLFLPNVDGLTPANISRLGCIATE